MATIGYRVKVRCNWRAWGRGCRDMLRIAWIWQPPNRRRPQPHCIPVHL